MQMQNYTEQKPKCTPNKAWLLRLQCQNIKACWSRIARCNHVNFMLWRLREWQDTSMFATIALLLLADEHYHNTRSLVSRTWAIPVVRCDQRWQMSCLSSSGTDCCIYTNLSWSESPWLARLFQFSLPTLLWSESDFSPLAQADLVRNGPTLLFAQTFVIKSDFPPPCHCQETLCCPDYIITRCSPVTVSDHPFLHLESPQSRF